MDQLSHGQILPCGKSDTVTTGDVLESEKMVAPPHKFLAPTSFITTPRGRTGYKGEHEEQSLQLKQGGSGGIGDVGNIDRAGYGE